MSLLKEGPFASLRPVKGSHQHSKHTSITVLFSGIIYLKLIYDSSEHRDSVFEVEEEAKLETNMKQA
jgi:hypothetical protein